MLEHDEYPRLQMLLIVMLTGGVGFFASFVMLQLGISAMGVRYFFAMCVAYIMFLVLLGIWLRVRSSDFDFSVDIGSVDSGSCPAPQFSGKGGSFDGGGASGDYDTATAVMDIADTSSGSVGDVLDVAGGADEAAIPVAAVLLVGAIVLSSLFVVYSAPMLFAELLVDGMLAASLYRRLRGLDRRHWLETAVRRTVWPFVLTAAVVTAAGWGMERYAPEAHSLGEVIHYQPAGERQ